MGTKCVEITSVDDKRQIAAVFLCTLSGKFLPMQPGNPSGKNLRQGRFFFALPTYPYLFPICSALAAMLERKEDGQEEWYSMVKNNHNGSVVLQYLVLKYNLSCPQCKCEKPQNSLPASSW